MGWSSGSNIMENIVYGLNQTSLSKTTREIVYNVIVESFRDNDWDTEDECVGLDEALDHVLLG